MPPAKAAVIAPRFHGNHWVEAHNRDRVNQDSNLVNDLRWQYVWETDETLEGPTTLRIEMERQLHRWANFMRNLHHLGTLLTLQNYLEAQGWATAAEVAKWEVEKLRVKRHLSSIVAGNVMLFHRCCRYMGTDPNGQVNGDRKSFRPDFLAWSEVWYDMMATFEHRDEIFEENGLAFQAEFNEGPPGVGVDEGAWRYYVP